MTPGKLVKLVLNNASRHRREFILSGFGIVVGVAAFVFFLSLSMGVRNKVLEVFPLERVEVIAPRAAFAGVDMTKRMDDSTVEAINNQEVVEIESVVPRMAIDFPVAVSGWFEGNRLSMDFVGDGVDPSYIREDDIGEMFKDWEVEDTPLLDCTLPKFTCEGLYYCDRTDMKCHHRVPVVISEALIEIYNSQFAKSRGLPAIGKMEQFIVQRGGLSKMRLYIDLGKSAVSMSNKPLLAEPRRVEGVLLGISKKAIPIGATVPMGYVKRWNKEYAGEESASAYSSIIVGLKDKEDVAPFGQWLMDVPNLRLEDSLGERFASIITIITLIFIIIALVIVTISAINIAHSFFMQVSERRREIGLLRAIGATQRNIRMLFVGEAALLGFLAGLVGVVVGLGIGILGDWAFVNHTADFAFKPKTLFDFQLWIPIAGLGVAVLFGVIGGALPARKAAKMQPAEALTQ
jgi:ABC-type antimicrobial peptide transport system permease subunit